MEFKIEKEIFESFPDFIAGVIFLKNCDNRGEAPEITCLLRQAEQEQTANEHPQLNAWRMAYRKFGADPHQYRCSAEALVRRALKGEVVYKDNAGVACRKWNWREAERTKLTEETKNAIIVIEALSPANFETVETAIKELASLIQKYCGGEINFHILSKEKQEI